MEIFNRIKQSKQGSNMPTYASSKLPPPRDWNEFEDIVCDAAKNKWKNPNITRYGRTGQRQNGIDIVGQPSYLNNRFAGIQCKNTEVDLISINKAITEAESFDPPIDEFIIALTSKRDTSLQSTVMRLSQERKENGKFSVFIWFWEDIELELSSNSELMEKHYPQFLSRAITKEKILEMIEDSDLSDWSYDSISGVYLYKKDVNLTIKRVNSNLKDEYREPWLDYFPDNKGFRSEYEIIYGNSLIKKELMVIVDGGRGIIPSPSQGYTQNPKITKWEYTLGNIIHSKYTRIPFDNFLRLAKISVVDTATHEDS